MIQIPDDPIVRCMEQTGFPPWEARKFDQYEEEEDDFEGDGDVYYGNEGEGF